MKTLLVPAHQNLIHISRTELARVSDRLIVSDSDGIGAEAPIQPLYHIAPFGVCKITVVDFHGSLNGALLTSTLSGRADILLGRVKIRNSALYPGPGFQLESSGGGTATFSILPAVQLRDKVHQLHHDLRREIKVVIDSEKLDKIGGAERTAHDELRFGDQSGKGTVALLAGTDFSSSIIRQVRAINEDRPHDSRRSSGWNRNLGGCFRYGGIEWEKPQHLQPLHCLAQPLLRKIQITCNLLPIPHATTAKIQIQQCCVTIPKADDQVSSSCADQFFFVQIFHIAPETEEFTICYCGKHIISLKLSCRNRKECDIINQYDIFFHMSGVSL